MTDHSTGEKFREFYDMCWLPEDVFEQTSFVAYFGIDSRLARYHLIRMCDEGLICQVTNKAGNAWYIHRSHKELFATNLTFRRYGVKVYPR